MSEKITVLIVDDEPMARVALRGIIEENFPQVHILAEVNGVPEAVKSIYSLKPDVVFLDIEMPGYSGIEILDFFENRHIPSKIVFVTAYEEYALKAFELSAVDYLLKPVRIKDLERAFGKLTPLNGKYLEVLKENLSQSGPKKISLQTGEGIIILALDEILYLKADGSYTQFYLTEGRKITVSKRLQEYERIISLGNFQRIHRSHIVNLHHIAKITREDGEQVLISNGDFLPISLDKKAALLAAFKDLKL